jgi:hypothetical protein
MPTHARVHCIHMLMGVSTFALQAGYKQTGASSNYAHNCFWDPPAECSGGDACIAINFV